MSTSEPLLPTVTRLRQEHAPGQIADAIDAIRALTRQGLTVTEIVRLCDLKPGNRGTVGRIRDGVIHGMRLAMAQAINDGYARYQAGDRSYIRMTKPKAPKRRVDLVISTKRPSKPKQSPMAEESPRATSAPEPDRFITSPGLRDRLRAARREGRIA